MFFWSHAFWFGHAKAQKRNFLKSHRNCSFPFAFQSEQQQQQQHSTRQSIQVSRPQEQEQTPAIGLDWIRAPPSFHCQVFSLKMSRFRSLLQASVNATKRALTLNLEDLVPPSERYIFKFDSKEELSRWHLYADSEFGGLSSASLEVKEATDGSSGTGVFSGNLSLDVDEGSTWNMDRSGFCGMRTKRFDGFIDLDAYDTLALKLKGDGRCYISTIYTENWVNSPGQQEDNSWQAFVFVPKDNWYIAKIPLARYLPTWRGNVIDAKLEMNPSRIVGMSLSVNAQGGVPGAWSGPGDFRVEVDWIKALRTQS